MAIKRAGRLLLGTKTDIPSTVESSDGRAVVNSWSRTGFVDVLQTNAGHGLSLNDGRSLLTRSPQHDVTD
jgi:hypothetical protein